MQVQPYQYARMYNQQNFKARFVANDNFIKLWTITPMTKSFKQSVEDFTNQHKSDVIEITKMNTKPVNGSYGTEYTVFNRNNGKIARYFKTILTNPSQSLSFLMDSISNDKNFLQQDGLAVELYKKLTTV